MLIKRNCRVNCRVKVLVKDFLAQFLAPECLPEIRIPPSRQKEIAMLIVTRRGGESVVLSIPGSDETIAVKVVQDGTQVRLGIDAPREVKILREELL